MYSFLTITDLILMLFGLGVSIRELTQILPDDDISWLIFESFSSITGGVLGLIVGTTAITLVEATDYSPAKTSFGLSLFFLALSIAIISWALSDETY
jgi:hypothetical protein